MISQLISTYFLEISLLLIGSFFTWIITHLYHRKNVKTRDKFYSKFSKEVQDMILTDDRDSLSIIEINDLLRSKIIDKNIKGLFQYKKCPKCGSDSFKVKTNYEVDVNPGDYGEAIYDATPFEIFKCEDCGWEKTELESSPEAFE